MPASTREDLRRFNYSHSKVVPVDYDRCASPWYYTHQIAELDDKGATIITVNVLFHYEQGAWRVVEFAEDFNEPDSVMCSDRAPAAVRPDWWECA
jgi:hypothetical protein